MTVRSSSRSLWWAALRYPKAVSRSRVWEIGGFLRSARTISSTPPAHRPGCRGRPRWSLWAMALWHRSSTTTTMPTSMCAARWWSSSRANQPRTTPTTSGVASRQSTRQSRARYESPSRAAQSPAFWCRAAAWSGHACKGSTPSNTSVSPHRYRATSRSCCAPGSPPPCSTRLCSILTRSFPWSGVRFCARFTCR